MALNPLSDTHPALAAEWHPTLNGDLTPDQVSAGSKFKAWWLGACGHEWDAVIGNRARLGNGCPYCSNQKAILGLNDFKTLFPDLAKEWHPTLNGDLAPEQFLSVSHRKVWWLGACGHEWDAVIGNRTFRKSNCPYCSGKKTLIGFNDLSTTFPQLAKEWHPTLNEDLLPEQFSAGSKQKVWWLGACGHEWDAVIGSRAKGDRKCPYCSGNILLSGFNDLLTTHATFELYWHPTLNGDLTPDKVSAGSRQKVWWLGECGHEWKAEIKSRVLGLRSCPRCSRGGFRSTDTGILYFIHNPNLLAFKVGITNPNSRPDRLKQFKSKGWSVIATWTNDSGLLILDVETKFFAWLRRELGIPQYLERIDVGAPQGASETFSDLILTQAEVIDKIEELLAQEIKD